MNQILGDEHRRQLVESHHAGRWNCLMTAPHYAGPPSSRVGMFSFLTYLWEAKQVSSWRDVDVLLGRIAYTCILRDVSTLGVSRYQEVYRYWSFIAY